MLELPLSEVAPLVAPVGIGALVGLAFLTLAAAIVAWGLVYLFDYTVGLLLDTMAGLVPHIPFVGGIAASAIARVKHNLRNRLVGAALGLEHAAAKFWHGAEQLTRYTADSIVWFGQATHDAIQALVDSVIPGQVRSHTQPLARDLGRTKTAADRRAAAEAKARTRGIDAVHRDLTAEKLARERGIDNVGARSLARTRAIEARLERQIALERTYSHRTLGRRVGLLERLLGVGALAGIALGVLTRAFPFWQCSNVRRFNRGLCRSPIGSLDWLFGLAATAVVALDLEEIVHEGTDVAQALGALWEEMVE
jgi:hypothetical protein